MFNISLRKWISNAEKNSIRRNLMAHRKRQVERLNFVIVTRITESRRNMIQRAVKIILNIGIIYVCLHPFLNSF